MNRYATMTFAALLTVATVTPAVAGDTRSRAADEPTVTQTRATVRQGHPEKEASVTHERAFDRARPENDERRVRTPHLSSRPHGDDEEVVKSPGPAASVELVPDEAESRCQRIEAQMRCTPVMK